VFRNVALAAGASTICFTYFQKGITGLLGTSNSILMDFAMRPSFSKGMALGAVLAMVVFGMYQRRLS
jgi:hypothetical protein